MDLPLFRIGGGGTAPGVKVSCCPNGLISNLWPGVLGPRKWVIDGSAREIWMF